MIMKDLTEDVFKNKYIFAIIVLALYLLAIIAAYNFGNSIGRFFYNIIH